MRTEVWWGNQRENDHLEDPDADGRIILKCFFRNWDGGLDWIGLPPRTDSWRAPVNAVNGLFGCITSGKFLD